MVLRSRPRLFLSHVFRILIHQPCYRSSLYNLITKRCVKSSISKNIKRFEGLTVVLINSEAVWDMTPCQSINIYWLLRDHNVFTSLLCCLTQNIRQCDSSKSNFIPVDTAEHPSWLQFSNINTYNMHFITHTWNVYRRDSVVCVAMYNIINVLWIHATEFVCQKCDVCSLINR